MSAPLENEVFDYVEDLNEHDILCGRGGGSFKHLGNTTYRHLVNLNKELYLSCKKHEKIKISQAIVAAIRSQVPPGRFVEKHPDSGRWYDIGDKKAVEKTSQALREGAPKLRSKLSGAPISEAEVTLAAQQQTQSLNSGDMYAPFTMNNLQSYSDSNAQLSEAELNLMATSLLPDPNPFYQMQQNVGFQGAANIIPTVTQAPQHAGFFSPPVTQIPQNAGFYAPAVDYTQILPSVNQQTPQKHAGFHAPLQPAVDYRQQLPAVSQTPQQDSGFRAPSAVDYRQQLPAASQTPQQDSGFRAPSPVDYRNNLPVLSPMPQDSGFRAPSPVDYRKQLPAVNQMPQDSSFRAPSPVDYRKQVPAVSQMPQDSGFHPGPAVDYPQPLAAVSQMPLDSGFRAPPALDYVQPLQPTDRFAQVKMTSEQKQPEPEPVHREGKQNEASTQHDRDAPQNYGGKRASSIYAPLPSNLCSSLRSSRHNMMFRSSNLSALTDYSELLSMQEFDDDQDLDDFEEFDPVNHISEGNDQDAAAIAMAEMQWSNLRSSSRYSQRSRSRRDSMRSVLSGMSDISVALSAIQLEEGDGEGGGAATRRTSVLFESGTQPVSRRGGFALDQFAEPKRTAMPKHNRNEHVYEEATRSASVRFSIPKAAPANEVRVDFDEFISSDRELNIDQIKQRGGVSGSSILRRQSSLSRFSMLTDAAGFLEDMDEGYEGIAEKPLMIWNAANTHFSYPNKYPNP